MARRKTAVRAAASKTRKTAARRARKAPDALAPEDVAFLFDRLQAEERSERLWSEMTSPHPEGGEAWLAVEEHLLTRAGHREHDLKRWKFFGK